MKVKTTAIALLALAAAVPLASQARSGPNAALDACVDSFVETYLPNHPVRQVKKRVPAPGPLDAMYRARNYTVMLSAVGAQSGELIAQARCVASNRGVVVVLDSPPESEYLAQADFVVSLR